MTRLLRPVTFILLIFFFQNIYCEGFLKASGKVIVDGSGKEILLRGIGLGGWLVPEGYMLQTSGFANSPTQIRNKIASLIGEANTDAFFRLYRSNYVKKKDIDSIAAWGFNSIRLPMHYNLLTPKDQPGVYLEEGFLLIDSLLSWCRDNKLYLILDLHAAPGGQNNEGISDYDAAYPSLWESEQNRTRTVELWKKIAERYANEEWIGGYDLINETKWDLGTGNVPLRNLFIQITNAIREVDKNHLLFIEGNWYATDFSGLTPPWDDNMAYSFHRYWNENNTGTISGYLGLRNSYNVPLWLGESGENSNNWFTECIEMLENNNIGWSWWPHKKIGSISSPFSAYKTPEYDYLLKYWNGQASKPTAAYAVDALTKMALNLDADKCEYNPDVIDAMFRQINNTETIPYTQHSIPGMIYCVDYDMGQNNFAYKDQDYQNTGGTDYNSGWRYRNDGVDVDGCTDILTNGYCVGWINTGEYLNYTIDVSQSGTYLINLRVAANNSSGKILLKLNGQMLGSLLNVPSTGGWQKWSTLSINNAYIPEGRHTLSVTFFYGGFNINFLDFKLIAADVNNEDVVPQKFEVYQNFPNPFNPSTLIKYDIPEAGIVQLKIFDLLGKEIESVSGYKDKGTYEYLFSSRQNDLSSGIYFYQVILNGTASPLKKALLLR